MVFTSKTLIPGKQPIGQNRDGSYIYDGQPMSVLPSKPITTQSTGIPNVGIPGIKGLTTPIAPTMSSKLPPVTFSADRAKEINARPAPAQAPTTQPTGVVIPKEEKIRRIQAMTQQGATPEVIQRYLDSLKAQETQAPQPQGTFTDQHADEGVIEQSLKALPRGIGEYAKGIWGNVKNTAGGVADVATSTFDAGKRLVTGDYYTKEEAEAERAKQRTGFLKATAGGTGLLTDIIPATAAVKVGFNTAAETPGLRVVPQAVGGVMNLGVQGLEAVGVSPENAQNLVTTAGNIALLKGGAKSQTNIMNTYKAKGLTPAVVETAKGVPRTIYQTAKQPVDLAVGATKLGGKVIDWGVGKTAQKILTNKTGTQELFQATSPSYNKLGKNIGIDKLKEKSALADEAVVRAGYKPKNTTERVDAYKSTMNDIWKDIEKARGGVKEQFSGREIGDLIRAKIEASKVNKKLSPSQLKDVAELQRWAEYYDSLGKLDMPKLAEIRTQINGETTWNKKIDNGDLFNKTFQDLAAVIRKTENNVIDSAKGGTFQGLMDRYGALSTMLDDVVKQDIKAQRAKGEGLTTTYSRIEGVGDIVKGVASLGTGGIKDVLKGGAKIVVGKTLSKLKETDFLIENGYNKLSKNLGLEKGPSKVPTKRVYKETQGLSPILESSNKSKSPSQSKGRNKLPKKSAKK